MILFFIYNLSLTVKMSKALLYFLLFCLLSIDYILLEKTRLYLFDNSVISNE